MKNIFLYLILIFFISGCTASSKTIQSVNSPKEPTPTIKAELVPVAGPIASYPQITNVISEFLDIKPAESGPGEERFLGVSENNLVSLEIIGGMDNISQVSMSLVYPKSMETLSADLNNAMMLRFLRNVAPEFEDWSNRTKDILDKFYRMGVGKIEEETIILDQKAIQVLYDKSLDSIILTVNLK